MELAYWNVYEGCLTPPRLLSLLAWAGKSAGEAVLIEVEHARSQMMIASSLAGAVRAHAQLRLSYLEDSTRQWQTDPVLAVLEVAADYFLLQRALAGDVRAAAKCRSAAETTAATAMRMWEAGRLRFPRTLTYLRDGGRIAAVLPAERVRQLSTVRGRRRTYPDGLFALLDQRSSSKER